MGPFNYFTKLYFVVMIYYLFVTESFGLTETQI